MVQGGESGGMSESIESAEAIGSATALRFVSRYASILCASSKLAKRSDAPFLYQVNSVL